MHFTHAVSGMAVTPDGKGYWLVAKDGGVFAFGDATFYGSARASRWLAPSSAWPSARFGLGYWLVEAGGQVLAFGSAPYEVASGKGHSGVDRGHRLLTPSLPGVPRGHGLRIDRLPSFPADGGPDKLWLNFAPISSTNYYYSDWAGTGAHTGTESHCHPNSSSVPASSHCTSMSLP